MLSYLHAMDQMRLFYSFSRKKSLERCFMEIYDIFIRAFNIRVSYGRYIAKKTRRQLRQSNVKLSTI